MNQPNGPDGRLRALYTAAAAGLDVATFVIQGVWLVCLVGLAAMVVALVAGVSRSLLSHRC